MQVKKIIISPNFQGHITNYVGDIAILVTKENFNLSLNVQPICIDWNNLIDFKNDLEGIVSARS